MGREIFKREPKVKIQDKSRVDAGDVGMQVPITWAGNTHVLGSVFFQEHKYYKKQSYIGW